MAVDVPDGAEFLMRPVDRFHQGRHGGDAHKFGHLVTSGAGAALESIQFDKIEAVLEGNLDVVPGAAAPQFQAHRQAPADSFLEFIDFHDQVVAAEDVRMARR